MKTVCLALFVLAVLAFAEAGRGNRRRGGNRGGRRPRPVEGPSFSWERIVESEGTTYRVEENAATFTTPQIVIFNSSDPSLTDLGYQPARVLYSFPEEGEQFMVIATAGNRRGRPCFVASVDPLSYDSFLDVLQDQQTDGEVEDDGFEGSLTFDGTVDAMSREQAVAFKRANPGVHRMCRRTIIDMRDGAQVTGALTDPSQIRTIKVFTLDPSPVEISFPVLGVKNRGGRRRGQAGGRGQGNRGQGRRGRGGRGGQRRGGRRSQATANVNVV